MNIALKPCQENILAGYDVSKFFLCCFVFFCDSCTGRRMFGSSCEKYLKIMGKKVNCSNLSEKLIGVFLCVSV